MSWRSGVTPSPAALVVKDPTANAGDITDPGLIPGSGRPPGEENGNPLHDSCLESPYGQRSLGGGATVHGVT